MNGLARSPGRRRSRQAPGERGNPPGHETRCGEGQRDRPIAKPATKSTASAIKNDPLASKTARNKPSPASIAAVDQKQGNTNQFIRVNSGY